MGWCRGITSKLCPGQNTAGGEGVLPSTGNLRGEGRGGESSLTCSVDSKVLSGSWCGDVHLDPVPDAATANISNAESLNLAVAATVMVQGCCCNRAKDSLQSCHSGVPSKLAPRAVLPLTHPLLHYGHDG